MPCRCDYMEPSAAEVEFQGMQTFYPYLKTILNLPKRDLSQMNRNDLTVLLCATIRELSPEVKEQVIYDAHNPVARKLADWWEKHEKEDDARIKRENLVKERAEKVKAALAKLTPEERKLFRARD